MSFQAYTRWAPHTGTAEQLFEETTGKLLKGGLEDQLFAALRANVDTFQPPVQGSTPSPGSIAGRVNSAMKEFGNMGSSVSSWHDVHAS